MNTTKPCPYCKEQVPLSATKCSHCQSDLRTWARRHPIVTFFLFIFLLGSIMSAFKSDESSANTSATQPTISAINSVKDGETGYLISKDKSDVLVASDEATYDRMGKLMAVKDIDGLTQMVLRGQLFYVESGTPIRGIGGTMFSREVRITSGKYSGQSGWVPAEWTSK
jgi:hypothetical protein